MQLSTGYWASKTLAAAHELGIFSYLSEVGACTMEMIAKHFSLHRRPAEILLTACVAIGLLEKTEALYSNTPLSEEFLVRGKPMYFGGWIEMTDRREYPAWGRVIEAVRKNQPTTWDPATQEGIFDGEDPVMMAVFWEAMHSLTIFTARELGRTLDLSGVRRLLDVGGGSGALDIELCSQYPDMRAAVFDLPFVCDLAREKITTAGLDDRIITVAGDFQEDDPFPKGYDTMVLSLILHDWDEKECRELLAKCYAGLDSGGQLIISELLVDDDKCGPPDAALMSMNMLVENWGRNYTAAEYTGWLHEAGFVDVRTERFTAAAANAAVIARKP
ncbi:acetylserotonin O-methyltransferase [Saccharopolyspora sp. ASAGF58]|uniref:acetylserotonin O-methyltransferase n=1 Tax=Saccharopolyspora sp. ASAGF58 TaxID=2719023 RepID=UPI0021110B3F|nr:acetylserotonin O-methyltransferase [Saccharopolyspora sp. ASAGF58]